VTAAENDPVVAKLASRYHTRPELEFFDLETDPYEMENLASDPAHASRITALRKQLDAWMVQQGDEGMVTELAGRKEGSKKR
jgi:hypothetical protein